MLTYDNSAFYYFMLSTLSLYLIPAIIFSVKRIISGFCCAKRDKIVESGRTSAEQKKFAALREETRPVKRVFTTGFVIQLFVLAGALYVFYNVALLVKDDKEIMTYDPFAILGLDTGASKRAIKSAYRRMSLKYHPDKNPDDPSAAENFMKVAKAYEALTDEVARQNWEKFGNPDGRQALQVSIGLPTFLLADDNHLPVLGVYLLVLLLVIPTLVCLWYRRSQQYGDTLVKIDSYRAYNFALSEHSHISHLPEVLSLSAEYLEQTLPSADAVVLQRLEKSLISQGVMKKPRHPQLMARWPAAHKTCILLHAYLSRHTDTLTETLQKDLLFILKAAPRLVEGMLEVAVGHRWLQTCTNIVEFQQMLLQALWVKDSSLLQLPHFTAQEVKHATSGRGSVRTLGQFVRSDQRKGMANFSEQQVADVEQVCSLIPDINLDVSVGVEDEEGIVEGDIVTITVDMIRRNVPRAEGEAKDDGDSEQGDAEVGPVHSSYFPSLVQEVWWVFLGDPVRQGVIAQAKITSRQRHVVEKMQMMAPAPGTYNLELTLKCNAYLGCDHTRSVKLVVAGRDTLPTFEPHPEDLELDNEPTLFQQMAGGADDSDSDFASSDSDSDDGLELTAAQRRRRRLRRKARAAAAGGSDDSDSSDGDSEMEAEDEEGDSNAVTAATATAAAAASEEEDEEDAAAAAAAAAPTDATGQRASQLLLELAGSGDGEVAHVSVDAVLGAMDSEAGGKLGRGEKRRLKRAIDTEKSRLVTLQQAEQARARKAAAKAERAAARAAKNK